MIQNQYLILFCKINFNFMNCMPVCLAIICHRFQKKPQNLKKFIVWKLTFEMYLVNISKWHERHRTRCNDSISNFLLRSLVYPCPKPVINYDNRNSSIMIYQFIHNKTFPCDRTVSENLQLKQQSMSPTKMAHIW